MHHLLLNVPTHLETKRLHLRPYQFGDGSWLHNVLRENSKHLGESIAQIKAGFGLDLLNPEEAEIFARQLSADWVARRRFVFCSWEKRSQSYVGDIWIECQDWDIAWHEIGYLVVEKYQGQGFASEGTRAGLKFIFEDLKANKVALTCDETNVKSYRVAERCGFIKEGHLRKQVKQSDGTLVGKLCYGMLKNEYETLKSV